MKKSLFFITCAALLFASCGSKPKVEEQVQEQVQEEIPEEVTEVIEEKAEEVKEIIPEVKDNSDILSATEAARKAAIDAGADKVAPDQLAATDALYKALEPQAKAGADVTAGLNDVKARYEALEKYAQALDLKAEIDDNNFSSFDPENYEKGNQIISDFTNLLSGATLSGAVMYEKADNAFKCYTTVLFKAYKSKAKEARTAAFKAKQNADSVKAGVAAKTEYNQAVEEFRSGDGSFAMQNPKAASQHYEKSASQFISLYDSVKAKREAAAKAMEEAKAAVNKIKDYAVEADKENPLTGENIEGIEAEDAVLLEEVKYEDPKASEAEISEDIEVEEPVVEIKETENVIVETADKVIDAAKDLINNGEAK